MAISGSQEEELLERLCGFLADVGLPPLAVQEVRDTSLQHCGASAGHRVRGHTALKRRPLMMPMMMIMMVTTTRMTMTMTTRTTAIAHDGPIALP